MFFRHLLLTGFADFFVDRAQNTVDEFAAVIPAKSFGEFNGFIDRNLRRHLIAIAKNKFSNTEPEDIAIYSRNFFKRPFWSSLFNDFVDYTLVFYDEIGQMRHEQIIPLLKAGAKFLHRVLNNLFDFFAFFSFEIPFKERLEHY